METLKLTSANILVLILGSSTITALITSIIAWVVTRKKTKVEITQMVTDISMEMIQSLREELERLQKKVIDLETLENDCLKEKKVLLERYTMLEVKFRELEVKYDISLKQNLDLKKKLDALKRRVENKMK